MANILQKATGWLDKALTKAGLLSEPVSSKIVAQSTEPFINRLPQINPEERDYQQAIIGYKDAYENAQKVYNEAGKILDDANSTQTARSQAERDRTAAQTAMDKAHKNADFVRKVAGNLNYDLSNYDANKTSLDDAKVNLATELQRDFINLRQNDLTPEQVHSRIYNKARDDGLTAGQARRLADQQTQEYQIKREALYNTFINMNARNGGLNNAAMWAINQIAKDSPIMASNYLNGYLTPQAQAQNDFNIAREQAARNDAAAMAMFDKQNAMEQLLQKFLLNKDYYTHQTNEDIRKGKAGLENSKELNRQQFEFTKILKDIDHQQQRALQKSQYEYATNLELQKAQWKAQAEGKTDNVLKDLETYDKRLSSNYNDLSKVLKDLNESLNPDEARIADITKQLQEIEHSRGLVRQAMLNGGKAPDDINDESYPITGNWDNDGPVVWQLNDWLYDNGYRGGKDDGEELRQRIIVDYLKAKGYKQDYAKEAVGAKW